MFWVFKSSDTFGKNVMVEVAKNLQVIGAIRCHLLVSLHTRVFLARMPACQLKLVRFMTLACPRLPSSSCSPRISIPQMKAKTFPCLVPIASSHPRQLTRKRNFMHVQASVILSFPASSWHCCFALTPSTKLARNVPRSEKE